MDTYIWDASGTDEVYSDVNVGVCDFDYLVVEVEIIAELVSGGVKKELDGEDLNIFVLSNKNVDCSHWVLLCHGRGFDDRLYNWTCNVHFACVI